jgi:GNAT superfamily N-acetyltransferase
VSRDGHLGYSQAMVRRLREDDLPALLRLYAFFKPGEEHADPRGATAQEIWRAILRDPKLHYFGLEAEGQLVSTCTLTIIPNLNHDLRPYGLIENVVTDPAWRKQGFAKQVLQHALREAWAARCYKVMLLTGSKKEETLRFYEQAGFQRGIKTGFVAYPV